MMVRPKDSDTVLRDPKTRRLLPEDGGEVPDVPFWRRRIRSGDVIAMDDIARGYEAKEGEEGEPQPNSLEPVTPLTTRSTEPEHEELPPQETPFDDSDDMQRR